jgi:WD40 repeat protein
MVDEPHNPALDATALDATEDARLDPTRTPADDERPRAANDIGAEHAATTDLRRYRVIREFARGGLGRILEVEDQTLGRRVAIKELRVPRGPGQARFLREATITARLQHPSIVPLYDVGRWRSGEPYYSMKLVAGRALDAVIRDAKTLDGRLALLPHVIAVADAIAYAHTQHIIHRDLKPANVLVGDFGETIVIDWGLAKDMKADEAEPDDGPFRTPIAEPALTVDGEVLGTPVYMAPEQAMGKMLDERADVYAIGAILYELLTGAWPHRGASSAQVIAQLVSGAGVTPIEQKVSGAPPDLIAIVSKAMEFDRERRYRTAAELAQELRRFQAGQLVAAHQYSTRSLIARWARRHRAPLAVGATLTAALAITAAISVRSIIRERDATQTERDATRAERDKMILVHARGELDRDPTAAVAWLKTYPSSGADREELRMISLEARSAGVATYVLRAGRKTFGRFSPDGRRFAWSDGTAVDVLDLADGRRTHIADGVPNRIAWSHDGESVLIHHDNNANEIARLADGKRTRLSGELLSWHPLDVDVFDPDDTGIIASVRDGTLVRYATTGGAATPVWSPGPLASPASFSRRGRHVVARTADGFWYWELGTTAARRLVPPTGVSLTPDVLMVAGSGDGARILGSTSDGGLCVWSSDASHPRVLHGNTKSVLKLVVASRTGGIVVGWHDDASLTEFDLDRDEVRPIPKVGDLDDLGISGDGRKLAIAQDHELYLVDLRTRERQHVGRHPTVVRRVTLSVDAEWLVSDGDDGSTRIWHRPGVGVEVIATLPSAIRATALSPDGERVAVLDIFNPSIELLSTRSDPVPLAGHGGTKIDAVAFAGDGKTLATVGEDDRVRIWDSATGREAHAPFGIAARSTSAVTSLTGRGIYVVADTTGAVRTLDLERDTETVLAAGCDDLGLVRSANDEVVACVAKNGGVDLISLRGAGAIHVAANRPRVIALSPDGSHLALGDNDGAVELWARGPDALRPIGSPRGSRIRQMEFSLDGAWLTTLHDDGTLVAWRIDDAAATPLQVDNATAFAYVVVGEGAALLAVGRRDGEVRIVDPASRAVRSILRGGGDVQVLAASRAGRVVVGRATGIVEVWTPVLSPGSESAAAPDLDALTTATLDASGTLASR